MQVIGTAGHVDHGKSTLIRRLTGINPDRLKEEQDREMSIELGFAWFVTPNGKEVGIIDVPGHRDFIENMLAGIGGIDAALFVVAADEGVMPQTREHLAILDLLQVSSGVVALTKTDLVKEPEWLDLVEADLADTLAGTVMADKPIIRVSAHSGVGISDLISALETALDQHPHRPDMGRPRLPIDRIFTLPGFGTIVTGTLIDGQLAVGDDVEILPQRLKSRIRGLQTHKQAEERALPGGRTAANVTGISVNQVERGDVLVRPGTYQSTTMIDIWCTLLPDADAPLKHNSEVKFFLGASEVMARVRLLGVSQLMPGKDAFLQLMLEKPVVAMRQDRFIIRRPSPPTTIGGGQVVDPHPKHRHKRFNTIRLAELESLLVGTPEDIMLQTAQTLGAVTLERLIETAGLEAESAKQAIETLIDQKKLAGLDGSKLFMTYHAAEQQKDQIKRVLSDYHDQFPLRPRILREQLKSQTGLASSVFDSLINQMGSSGIVVENGVYLRLHQHEIRFSPQQQEKIDRLMKQFAEKPFSPPSRKQSHEIIGEELTTALIAMGRLIPIGEDILFQPSVYDKMQDAVIQQIQENGSITLGELRDKFDTSRKYAVAMLEHLDQKGITIRRGDVRILKTL